MRKSIAYFLVLSMLMGCLFSLPMTAFALTEGDWEFELLNNEAKITGYIGSGGDVVIPDTLYGVPVTMIELDYRKTLDNVVSVTVPGSVASCGKLATGNIYDKLRKVVFKEGVTEIGDNCFWGSGELETVVLPEGLERIGASAFRDAANLSQVDFPKSLKSIGYAAFSKTGLEHVDLSHLGDVEYSNSVFSYCKQLKSVSLNPSMTVIQNYMFHDCEKLSFIDIPASVETIEQFAFSGAGLESVILPSKLKSIAQDAFAYTKLTEVTIPYGTESVDAWAFASIDTLQSLYIPDSVVHLSSYNVINNSKNAIIYCGDGSAAAEVCKKNQISYLTDSSVNSGVTVLYNGKRVSFHSYGQNPEITEGRTLVPLRSIFEKMNAAVDWNGDTDTVTATRGNITVKLTIGENVMYKNGEKVSLDVPAQLVNGRTMIPVRVIAEAFGADVQWNGNGNVVLIEE